MPLFVGIRAVKHYVLHSLFTTILNKMTIHLFFKTQLCAASIHTSSVKCDQKTWKIPERLQGIPTAEDPSFFNMVEYYFHKACILGEPRFVDLMETMRISEEEKKKKVRES